MRYRIREVDFTLCISPICAGASPCLRFLVDRALPRDLTQEIRIVYPPRKGLRVAKTKTKDRAPEAAWTFLTNHSHVLLCLVQDPEARMRDVADKVGITERAVQRIVSELEAAGYVSRTRDGRRNTYEVNGALPLRHAVEGHQTLNALIKLILD